MLNPTRKLITLRPYQQEVIDDFTRWLDEAAFLLALVSPTGSGKTVTLVEFLAGARGRFRASVVATPSTIIEDGFARTAGDLLHRPRANKASDRGAFTEYLMNGCDDYLGWLTTHQQLTVWGLEALPANLSGCLLVLDEAHHAGVSKAERKLNTEIGKLRETWTARGGIAIFVTATPFRTDKNDIMPPETRIHCRPAAVHALSGYAPDHWLVETAMLTQVVASTLSEFQGDDLSEGENKTGESFRQVIARWEGDGRPKAVFIVPPNNSRAWADRLILELTKAGARVHDAVGTSKTVADKLNDVLATERDVKDVSDSKIDVIVACRRFDEGADWPLCSHVYCYGIPRSLVLILQRFGRAQRDKQDIAGHTHPRTAKITFFVPRVSDDLLDKFTKDHHKLACTLGLVMERFKAGSDLSADINVQRHASWTSENKAREARGEAPLPRPALIRDDEMLDAESNLLLNLREMKRSTGQEPTEGTIAKLVEVQSTGKSERAQQVIAAAGLSLIRRANPASVRPGAEDMGDDFKAELARRMEESQDRTVTFDDGVFRVMSEILGSEAMERSGAEKPDLTEEMIVAAARRHYARTGKWPNLNSGDATLDFGFTETWAAVVIAVQRMGRNLSNSDDSLSKMLERNGCVKRRSRCDHDDLTEIAVAEAGRRYKHDHGGAPKASSGDATEYFGEPKITWMGISHLCRRLFGKRLTDIMVHHGISRPPTDPATAVNAQKAYHVKHGKWPSSKSGDATDYFGFPANWSSENQRLQTQGTSLAQLRVAHQLDLPRKSRVVSTIMLLVAVIGHINDHGKRPSKTCGDASRYLPWQCKWAGICCALRNGHNKLPGNSSLSKFIDEHFDANDNLRDGVAERYGLTRERLLSLTKDDFNADGTLKDPGHMEDERPKVVEIPAVPLQRKSRTPRQPKVTAMPVQVSEVEPTPPPVEPTPSPVPTVPEVAPCESRPAVGRLGRWFGREGMALTMTGK